MDPQDHSRRRHNQRARCIPPAMLHNPADRLEGDSILREAPEGFGLLLWRAARDVTLWSDTPQPARGSLFSVGTAAARSALLDADLPGTLRASVGALHRLLCLADSSDDHAVAQCCLEIARAAHDLGLHHAAMAFAQAAALATPTSGDATLVMGIYAHAAGQDVRAETWLRRAVAVARREGNRSAYCMALLEMGALYEARGTTVRAERLYRLAFKAARRCVARAVRMRCAQALFRIARQRGDEAAAVQIARRAQRALLPEFDGAPELLLDLARFWTDTGEPPRARAALRRVASVLGRLSRHQQLTALALTARAHAVSGRDLSGMDVAVAAWARLDDENLPDRTRYSAALDLAHAATIAGDLPAFGRAQRAVLRLAPHQDFPAVVDVVARLWPNAEKLRG